MHYSDSAETSAESPEHQFGFLKLRAYSEDLQHFAHSLAKGHLPDEAFVIRNLDDGSELNLRDEIKPMFGVAFARLVGDYDHIEKYRRLFSRRAEEMTLLMKACVSRDLSTVQSIVGSANLLSRGLLNWTALHFAVEGGSERICRVLLESGQEVDINAQTSDGVTALMLAALKQYMPIVRILIDFGADLSVKDAFGHCVLSYADSAIKDYLLQQCSDLPTDDERVDHVSSPCDSPDWWQRKEDNREIKFAGPYRGAGDYDPICLLAQGAFKKVYYAVEKEGGKCVALKVIDKTLAKGVRCLQYIQTEQHVLKSYTHPFIEELLCNFQTPQKLVLVSRYYPCGSLRDRLNVVKRLSEQDARMYAAELFLALEFLHRSEIVFRDLKPENVLFDEEGHVRLVDFGLSKEQFDDEDLTKSFCGTSCYMAPEVLARTAHNKQVDWYSFGVLLFEMMTGRIPFFAVQDRDLLQLMETEDIPFPPEMSVPAKSLIHTLLRASPSKRLGAGRVGRKAIRTHAFFDGIDWNLAYSRGLPVPRLTPLTPTGEKPSISEVFGSLRRQTLKNPVLNW